MAQLWHSYTLLLARRPLQTRMVTSGCLFTLGDLISQQGLERRGLQQHDVPRTMRLAFYGTVLFAPMVNQWLKVLEKIKFDNRVVTALTKATVDVTVWGPFIVGFFWTANGVLEGKSIPQIKEKVSRAFVPSYTKSVMVFGPTQILNFLFVPVPYRLLASQCVGTGWNTFLSWSNNRSNLALSQIGI